MEAHSEVFRARIEWKREQDAKGLNYSRDHRVVFPGKSELAASSGTAHRGSKDRVNPEEMLAASVASCQMMTYLYLCARNNMVVLAYTDEAIAQLAVDERDKHAITKVTLHPRITFAEAESQQFRAMAIRLIHEAHGECYISNSIRGRVDIEPLLIWT